MNFQADEQKKIIMLLGEHFKWDIGKIYVWIGTPNPHLGMVSPLELIMRDRSEKVLKFFVAQNGSCSDGFSIVEWRTGG